MIREVDLVSYLPPFLAEYKEINTALAAENPEFCFLWEAADRMLRNEFILSADEYGISRFEKMLGILPSASDTLENRRARVQNRWFNTAPYTIRTLTRKLRELLGGDHNFSIWSDFEKTYQLILTVYSTNDSRLEEIKYLLSAVIPADIVTDIIYESAHDGKIYCGAVMKEADIIEIGQR